MEVVEEALADEDQAGDHEHRRDVHRVQADLGLEDAGVAVDVAAREEVVEEVAEKLAQEDADDGREVEEADVLVGVAVATKFDRCGEEDGGRDVDSNCPGKDEEAGR
jgi:hypothetical protein